jgi:hypothetical protein
LSLEALGLTPAQLVEIEQADDGLVAAWLAHVLTSHGVHSPAGLFLSGVRSGNMPGQLSDEQERKALARAERFIRQVGYICETEQELRAELAERKWPCDDRLVELWRVVRPVGEQLERDTIERAEQARKAMQRIGMPSVSATESTKPLHTSQVWVPLTRVSAISDPDADIAW